MIDNFTFLNLQRGWPILIVAILLLAVFLWKEWAQAGNHRIILKSFLSFLAIAALVIIALKPALPTEETTKKLVLLTEGYEIPQLDSLKDENNRLREFNYIPGEPLSKELISAEKVFVLGHGIKEYDLWQLQNISAKYVRGNDPEGVVKLNYKMENAVGDKLSLKGLYKKPVSGNKLVLQGPGNIALDSLVLKSGEDQQFQLLTELKVAGKYVFSLVVKDSLGEMLNSDPVPVVVSEKDNLKVLVINSFPTFETKYLKNFLAEAGHELVVRSQITRGRYKYEYFNTDRTAVNNLSETTLDPFDLLIIDAATLRTLSGSQVNAVENSVRNEGLGLFIQADDASFNSSGKLYSLKFKRVSTTEITADQWPGIKLTRFPYEIVQEFGLQPIQRPNVSIASAYKRTGQGRIGTTVFSTTWQLLLDGNNEAYKELWSHIIEEISKKQNPVAEWEQDGIVAYQDEPFDFKLRTGVASPKVKSGSIKISLVQHPDFPEVWTGTTWPRESGWNNISLDTTAIFNLYVAEENHWSSLNASNTIQANQAYFQRPAAIGVGKKPLEPINPVWFFLVFLICIGGLWLEPKL